MIRKGIDGKYSNIYYNDDESDLKDDNDKDSNIQYHSVYKTSNATPTTKAEQHIKDKHIKNLQTQKSNFK